MIGAVRQRAKHVVKQRLGPFVAARRPQRIDLPLSTWDVTVTPAGTLAAGRHDLAVVAAEIGTPTHVVRSGRLDAACERALAPVRAGTGADIFYSYKTNPVPAVLRRLHDHGIGAEVISAYELWLALELGVPADRIIYNGPAKSEASLRTAIERGVLLINANTAAEAVRIGELAQGAGRPANLGLRISLPGMWGGQFGLAAGSPEIATTVRRALADPAVTLSGLHFHRGVTIRDGTTMSEYVGQVLEFCAGLHAETGWSPELLDLGGSLACPTVAPFEPLAHRLNRAIGSDLLPPDPSAVLALGAASELATSLAHEDADRRRVPRPRVVLEPGRSLTGSTQLLLTTVVDVKPGDGFDIAILDAGINIAEPVTNEYHQLLSVTAAGAPAERAYRLAGPICTPADVLYNHWRLPGLSPGHVLAVMDTGAYFVPFSTNFSFPKPAIVVEDGDTLDVVTRRQDFADMVSLERW